MKKYSFVAIMLAAITAVSLLFTNLYVKSSSIDPEDTECVVVTSFYPLYIAALNLTENVQTITLHNLSEPQTGCLHDYQLTPADMKLLSQASLFLVNGGGIEGFLSDVASAYPSLTIGRVCREVALLGEDVHEEEEAGQAHHDEAEHDAAEHEGDVHDHEINAHAWMSVAEYRIMVSTMAEDLCQAAPEEAERIRENAARYDKQLQELVQEQEKLKEKALQCKVILFHEAYEYVAEEYGMCPELTVDLDEERQIGAGEVADVLRTVDEGAGVILAEELYGRKLADTILREREAVKVIYLDPLTRGDYEKDSYLKGMMENIRALQAALSE